MCMNPFDSARRERMKYGVYCLTYWGMTTDGAMASMTLMTALSECGQGMGTEEMKPSARKPLW